MNNRTVPPFRKINYPDRNFIINGAFDFAQRIGTGQGNITTSGAYFMDRFKCKMAGGATTGTVEQSSFVPNATTKTSAKFLHTPTDALHRIDLQQYIEAKNIGEMAGKYMSLGFWVYSESATEMFYQIRTPTVEDDFGSVDANMHMGTLTIPTLGEWNFISLEGILLDANVSRGLEVFIDFTTMSILGSARSHHITQIMFNEGPKVLPFVRAGYDYHGELAKCQRYYLQRPDNIYVSTGYNNECYLNYMFPVTMRAAGTLTYTSTNITGVVFNASAWGMKGYGYAPVSATPNISGLTIDAELY